MVWFVTANHNPTRERGAASWYLAHASGCDWRINLRNVRNEGTLRQSMQFPTKRRGGRRWVKPANGIRKQLSPPQPLVSRV